MRRKTVKLQNEHGHLGADLTSVMAIVGTVLLAIGLGNDTTSLSVAGAIVLGLSSILGVNAPHFWLRSVYRRLDRVSPEEGAPRRGIRSLLEL